MCEVCKILIQIEHGDIVTEAGGSQVWGYPGLHNGNMSQNIQNKIKIKKDFSFL